MNTFKEFLGEVRRELHDACDDPMGCLTGPVKEETVEVIKDYDQWKAAVEKKYHSTRESSNSRDVSKRESPRSQLRSRAWIALSAFGMMTKTKASFLVKGKKFPTTCDQRRRHHPALGAALQGHAELRRDRRVRGQPGHLQHQCRVRAGEPDQRRALLHHPARGMGPGLGGGHGLPLRAAHPRRCGPPAQQPLRLSRTEP